MAGERPVSADTAILNEATDGGVVASRLSISERFLVLLFWYCNATDCENFFCALASKGYNATMMQKKEKNRWVKCCMGFHFLSSIEFKVCVSVL
jgi:hypothetical protein